MGKAFGLGPSFRSLSQSRRYDLVPSHFVGLAAYWLESNLWLTLTQVQGTILGQIFSSICPTPADKRVNHRMHLYSLAFSGYRSFAARSPSAPLRQLEQLRLAPLTILIGKNNSGKSTAARLLHHILLALGSDGVDPFPMADDRRSYGARFRDIQHESNFFNPLDFEVELGSVAGKISTVQAQLSQPHDRDDDSSPVVEKLIFDGEDFSGRNDARGLLPNLEMANHVRDGARRLLAASCHLAPIRDAVQRSYAVGGQPQLPHSNAAIAQLMLSNSDFRAAMGDWMASNLDGWRVDVQQTLDDVKLLARRTGREANLADAGQGIQQVLPVAALCCWRAITNGDEPFLDVIEQPELHLHDAAHAALGDLLLDAVVSRAGNVGKAGSIVVETHSESLVLRVRRRIAEGLSPKLVEIVFVEDKGDGSHIRRIPLRSNGEVEWWPEGVFSEAFEEVKAIRRAQRISKGS